MSGTIHYLYAAFRNGIDTDTPGGRIWSARDKLGLSLNDIAKRLGVSTGTVSQWERDRAEPPSDRLFALASILRVSPAWLMTGLGDEPGERTEAPTVEGLREQLVHVRRLHERTGRQIAALEREIERTMARLR